jgi:uncharacterized protein YceK
MRTVPPKSARRRARARFGAACAIWVLLASSSGCAAIECRIHQPFGYHGPNQAHFEWGPPYAGTRFDLEFFWLVVTLVDLPFTFLLDTVFLPWDLSAPERPSGSADDWDERWEGKGAPARTEAPTPSAPARTEAPTPSAPPRKEAPSPEPAPEPPMKSVLRDQPHER